MNSKASIDRILNKGIEILRSAYGVYERRVDPAFASLNVGGRIFDVRQYEVAGVGNLTTMQCVNMENWCMATFILSPYYKNIPLFTSDFIFDGDNRQCVSEIYSLVAEQPERYAAIVGRFKSNMDACALEDVPCPPSWYDAVRPAYVIKKGAAGDDEAIFDLFERNVRTFVAAEQSEPFLPSTEARIAQWRCIYDHAARLISEGGVSTNMFKMILGEEKTKQFFFEVFFAPERFRID